MKYPRNTLAILMVGAAAIGLSTCSIWQTNNPLDPSISHTANVALVAGTKGVAGTADGTGSGALFGQPNGIATDGTNLYVTDTANNNIRKIVISTGAVSTLAGSTTGQGGYSNATGTAARFSSPLGICTDGTNLYVADEANLCIRKVVISTGVVSTFAGGLPPNAASGTADGTGTAARFMQPYRICTDGTNLYITDGGRIYMAGGTANNIRQIVISSAAVTTLAGSKNLVAGSADGPGASALFDHPGGLCLIGTTLYVQDNAQYGPWTLRLIQLPGGTVTTQNYPSYAYNYSSGVGDSPVYDGSGYIYSGGGSPITKVDSSSWYGININTSPYSSFDAVCLSGSDVYFTSVNDHVIVKLLNVSTP